MGATSPGPEIRVTRSRRTLYRTIAETQCLLLHNGLAINGINVDLPRRQLQLKETRRHPV